MKRIRIQKPKPRRRIQHAALSAAPRARAADAHRLLEELETLLVEIDGALEPDRD